MSELALSAIMELLNGSRTLYELTDGYYTTENILESMTINKQHKTVVGVSDSNDDTKLPFWSDVRDVTENKYTFLITVLSAMNNRSDYCNRVTKEIVKLFKDNEVLTKNGIIFYIDSIKYELKPSDIIGRWVGTVSIEVASYQETLQ
jgi:hypothetical protein